MSVKKKLDKKKLEYYKKLLLAIKEKIEGDIKQMASVNIELSKDIATDASSHAMHMADVATDMYDREFNLGLVSNDRELLYEVNNALQRIDEKIFGVCRMCQKSIPQVRLKAIPYTETCLKCQKDIEEKK